MLTQGSFTVHISNLKLQSHLGPVDPLQPMEAAVVQNTHPGFLPSLLGEDEHRRGRLGRTKRSSKSLMTYQYGRPVVLVPLASAPSREPAHAAGQGITLRTENQCVLHLQHAYQYIYSVL